MDSDDDLDPWYEREQRNLRTFDQAAQGLWHDAQFSFRVGIAKPEDAAWRGIQLHFFQQLAAVAIQRLVRGAQARARYFRLIAARELHRIAAGLMARRAVARMAASAVAAKQRRALQGEGGQPSTVLPPPAPPRGNSPAAVPPTEGTVLGVLSKARAANVIQRAMRRVMPVLRARKRAVRVHLVVRSAVKIQCAWRGYAARRAYSEDLRRQRWSRQLKQLAEQLRAASTAPESQQLQHQLSRCAGRARRLHDGSDPLESLNGNQVDPATDAAYFRSLGKVPVPRPRRPADVSRHHSFVSASLGALDRALDVAEREADEYEWLETQRRLRELRRHQRRRSPSAVAMRSAIQNAPRTRLRISQVIDRLHYGEVDVTRRSTPSPVL
jgi:hypothetical protein